MRCHWPAAAHITVLVLLAGLTHRDVWAQNAASISDPPTCAGRWRTTADMSDAASTPAACD